MSALLASLAAALLLAGADPAPEPALGAPPRLEELPAAEVPPGTAFPGPEVAVVLSIDVSATGAVEDVRIAEGAGEPFDSAALAAAREARFTPARLTTGEPVPVTIAFRLRIVAPPPPPPPPVVLSGRLLERGTRRPVPGVPIAARDETGLLARGESEADGRFELTVPATRFTLVAASPGHERLEALVEASPGERREEVFHLRATGAYEAVVRAPPLQGEVSRQVLTSAEVAKVPGTQGDTLGAVLNLPGVARTSFGGVALILRGASPGDSRVFLEGQEIPILYHFGGLRSTVNPRFLQSVEFVPGNFSADHGRAIGGIVDVRLRDPAADLFRGDVTVSFYDAGFSLEGPLGGGWAGGVAFHRSWIDSLLPLVIPKDSNVSFDTAPRYYDYQLLATRRLAGDGRLRLLWFGSLDKVVVLFDRPAQDPSISGSASLRTMFHALQAELATPVAPWLRQESSLQLALQQFRTSVGPQYYFDLSVNRIAGRSAWTADLARGLTLHGGIDVVVAPATVSVNAPQIRKEGEPQDPVSTRPVISAHTSQTTCTPAAFLEVRLAPARGLTVTPGVRLDWTSAIRRWTVDPRLTARYELASGTALKGGVGLFQQPPAPDESSPATGTPRLLAERAVQVSAGAEQRLLPGLDAELTAFHKRLDRLVVRNPSSVHLDQGGTSDPAVPRYVNSGRGRIYGLEALVRGRLGERAFGWIAYTYQRSLRRDAPGAPERRFDWDQPHILTAVGSWTFAAEWSAGVRYRLVSGNPVTPVTGSVLDAASGVYVPTYGAVNGDRLPAFSQLDVRVDRTWTARTWKLTAFLDVQNVTNRGNAEGFTYNFDYSQRKLLTGLPILPILGVEGQW